MHVTTSMSCALCVLKAPLPHTRFFKLHKLHTFYSEIKWYTHSRERCITHIGTWKQCNWFSSFSWGTFLNGAIFSSISRQTMILERPVSTLLFTAFRFRIPTLQFTSLLGYYVKTNQPWWWYIKLWSIEAVAKSLAGWDLEFFSNNSFHCLQL